MPRELSIKGNVKIGNPDSNNVVCALWTNSEVLSTKLDADSYAFIGNLYSFEGINLLIRTFFQNPHLRRLVVYGADLIGNGDLLVNLLTKGVDENHYIKGTKYQVDKTIPLEDIALFCKSIELNDMRNQSLDEVGEQLKKMNEQSMEPFTEPKEFPVFVRTFDSLPSEGTGYLTREPTKEEVWVNALDLVVHFGNGQGDGSHALVNGMNVVYAQKDEKNNYHTFSEEQLHDRLHELHAPSDQLERFITLDQDITPAPEPEGSNGPEKVAYNLQPHYKKPGFKSYTIRTRVPTKGMESLMYTVQNNELYATAVFNTQDWYNELPIDLAALRMEQSKVAGLLDLSLGALTLISHNGFVRKGDWEAAKKLVADDKSLHRMPFVQDQRSSFVINIREKDGKKFLEVQHYTVDGIKTDRVFTGTDPNEIFKEMARQKLIIRVDHAYYLSRELWKAFRQMRNEKEYVQDVA